MEPRYRSTAIIESLSTSTDIQRVLDEHKISAAQLLQMLRSANARRQLSARRRLARIHSELVANRFGPYAMHKLCQLLSDDKSELRLKGALSVLAAAGLDGKGSRGAKKKQDAQAVEDAPAQTPEEGEVLLALAEVLRQRRAQKEGA